MTIQNVVFSGGGIKGLAFVGAIDKLFNSGYLKSTIIKRYAGTSAGAIIATLLSLGYTEKELYQTLFTLNFKSFLDESGLQKTSGKLLKSVHKSERKGFFASSVSALSVCPKLLSSLFEQFGIYDGDTLRLFIEQQITNKLEKTYLTFSELHAYVETQPELYKDLYIVAADLTSNKTAVFSWETTPDMIISDAVRCSISIPFLFRPHRSYIKNKEGQRVLAPDAHFFIDGGITKNFFLEIFDLPHYIDQEIAERCSDCSSMTINEKTLGLRLVNAEIIDSDGMNIDFLGIDEEMKSVILFSLAMVRLLHTQQNEIFSLRENIKRTICIDNLNINPIAFDLSTDQQKKLVASGKSAALSYLEKQKIDISACNEDGVALDKSESFNWFIEDGDPFPKEKFKK